VVTSAAEHAAVEEACRKVAAAGGEHVTVPTGERGVVAPDAFDNVVDSRTGLVSLVQVTGEIGTVQPVQEVARRVKALAPKCRVHTDAVQALAQLAALDLPREVDMVSVSAHKIHGPQGVGALLLRPGIAPRPIAFGGDQQDRIRPGTLNLPGIAGFAEAARLLMARRETGVPRMARLSERLVSGVVTDVPGAHLLGDAASRAPGMATLAFDGVKSGVLLHSLETRGVLASSGSACHATRTTPPRSLVAAGLKADQGAVRFSLSLDTKKSEIDETIQTVKEVVAALRRGRAIP
jgi:cysteine desulfurase